MNRPEPWKKQGRELPAWVKAIPQSPSHGSGHLQKRLWRLVSDTVRIRDWYLYKGACVATGTPIPSWREGNAGHFKGYQRCNGLFKFDIRNIHLQSARSNSWGDFEEWKLYEAEIKRRYGDDYPEKIHQWNLHYPVKFSNSDILAMMLDLIDKMGSLPEQPDYYPRVKALLSESMEGVQ